MFDKLYRIADGLGLLERAKQELITRPDPAAKHLASVLEELSKIYKAIDAEITNYLSIWFDAEDPKGVVEGRKTLIGLEGGRVRVRMAEARGHCSKISNIYTRYLSPWVTKVFDDPVDVERMSNLFTKLHDMDFVMVEGIKQLADWLEKNSHEVLEHVGKREYKEANEKIEADRKEVLQDRLKLSEAVQKMFDLQAAFIGVSGALEMP